MGRERRRRNRTRTAGASDDATTGAVGTADEVATYQRPSQVRSDRVIERESRTMIDESKRVAWVSAICFGMLAVLIVIDRLQ